MSKSWYDIGKVVLSVPPVGYEPSEDTPRDFSDIDKCLVEDSGKKPTKDYQGLKRFTNDLHNSFADFIPADQEPATGQTDPDKNSWLVDLYSTSGLTLPNEQRTSMDPATKVLGVCHLGSAVFVYKGHPILDNVCPPAGQDLQRKYAINKTTRKPLSLSLEQAVLIGERVGAKSNYCISRERDRRVRWNIAIKNDKDTGEAIVNWIEKENAFGDDSAIFAGAIKATYGQEDRMSWVSYAGIITGSGVGLIGIALGLYPAYQQLKLTKQMMMPGGVKMPILVKTEKDAWEVLEAFKSDDQKYNNLIEAAKAGEKDITKRDLYVDANGYVSRIKTNISSSQHTALVGTAGIGKSALGGNGVAQAIVAGQFADTGLTSDNTVVVQLEMAKILGGENLTQVAINARIDKVLKAVRILEKKNNVIVYVDEMAAADSGVQAKNREQQATGNLADYFWKNTSLKSFLTRPKTGSFKTVFIAATTANEWHIFIAPDATIVGRFSRLPMDDPGDADSRRILSNPDKQAEINAKYGQGRIKFTEDGINALIELANQDHPEIAHPRRVLGQIMKPIIMQALKQHPTGEVVLDQANVESAYLTWKNKSPNELAQARAIKTHQRKLDNAREMRMQATFLTGVLDETAIPKDKRSEATESIIKKWSSLSEEQKSPYIDALVSTGGRTSQTPIPLTFVEEVLISEYNVKLFDDRGSIATPTSGASPKDTANLEEMKVQPTATAKKRYKINLTPEMVENLKGAAVIMALQSRVKGWETHPDQAAMIREAYDKVFKGPQVASKALNAVGPDGRTGLEKMVDELLSEKAGHRKLTMRKEEEVKKLREKHRVMIPVF